MWGNPPQRMLAGAPTGNTSNPQLSFDWVLRPLPQSCRIANSDTEVLKVRSARGTCSMDILVAEADAGLAAAYRQFHVKTVMSQKLPVRCGQAGVPAISGS